MAQKDSTKPYALRLASSTLNVMQEALRQSDATYYDVVEHIADGYYELNLKGGFTFVNAGFCQMIGRSRSELLATRTRHYTRYLNAESAERLQRALDSVCRTSKPENVELYLTGKDNCPRYLDVSIAPICSQTGETIGFRGIARDITERKAAEIELNRRVNLLAVLQQVDVELNQTLDLEPVLEVALNAAMLMSNADCGYISLNEAGTMRVARATGAYKDSTSPPVGIAARALRRERAEFVDNVLIDPDHEPVVETTQAQITIPLIAHNKVIGLLNLETDDSAKFTEDVFEFAQLLASRIAAAIENARLYSSLQAKVSELQDLYEQVSALEQLKTDMIRIAAHDMRSPLAVIFSYVEMLREDLAPHMEEHHKIYLNAIQQSVSRITRMSSEILTLERVQDSTSVPDQRVSLAMVVQRVADEHGDEIRQKQQTIGVSLPEESTVVLGEPTELVEAVSNLISNAIKYTPDGGRVEARLRVEDNSVILEVEDNGFGIPDEEQARIFEPFHRVKTRETRLIDGTGLGLYLVRKIVERHGGTTHFRSTYGQGSVFGFRLPLAPQETPVAG